MKSTRLAAVATVIGFALLTASSLMAELKSPEDVKTQLKLLGEVSNEFKSDITAKNFADIPHENMEYSKAADALRAAIKDDPTDFKGRVDTRLNSVSAAFQKVSDMSADTPDADKLMAAYGKAAFRMSAVFDLFEPPLRPYRTSWPPELSSEELAKQPQTSGATGDQERHYYFADAKVESPYRLYVPKKYDGKTKLPLIIALHGAGGQEDYFFRSADGTADLLEKFGFIFVSPLGYSAFGGYGSGSLERPPVTNDPLVQYPTPNPNKPKLTPEETARVDELSEKDVMNVIALVEKEYAVDTSRVYLMGHSMGGMGTWYLGQKYADKWAGLGVMSGGFGYKDYPLERIKGIPLIIGAGSLDIAMHGDQAQAEVARFKAAGLNPVYIEIPDATHMSMIPSMLPQVIEFFATHRR